MKEVEFIDLGLKDYKETWDYQEDLLGSLVNRKLKKEFSKIPKGFLIFVEHPHVYTLGKSGEQNNLLIKDDFLKKINATFYKINRGGDITYHGPGQIVGYPILDLDEFNLSVREYVTKLEDAIISLLADFGIPAARLKGATGVWLDVEKEKPRKICAIGVRVSRGVTMHGFAFNVNTDLQYFRHINPCGFIDKEVTSMSRELGYKMNFEEIKEKLKNKIGDSLGMKFHS